MDDKQLKNSHKVNVNGGGVILDIIIPGKELYKSISEETVSETAASDEVDSKSEQSGEKIQTTTILKLENGESTKMAQEESITDGADEQMLGAEDEKLAEKREEVKFIKGDQLNGDAKIDIDNIVNGKAFTGMTKEELMKYANDPFWVRLRWIFFISFWLIWVGMLLGAILIILNAPKCAAPEPLPWYKRGILGKFNSIDSVAAEDLVASEKLKATGVIYELPAELTYNVADPEVEQKIKTLVAQYKDSGKNLILDITPNYVTKDSQMMKNALTDRSKRSAFMWVEKPEVPNNWVSIENGPAWSEVQPGNYVLSQFGEGLYDLRMNDTIVRSELGTALQHLIKLGIKGFRLKNTKFYLISSNLQDEVPSNEPNYIHTQYGFWTHAQTTFQEGLGDVLHDYLFIVKNASADAFLSVSEDVMRPEVYRTSSGFYGIDMPIYGRFINLLTEPQDKKLQHELQNVINGVGNETWIQWSFGDVVADDGIDPTAYELFMSLVPGVPVLPVNSVVFKNVSANTFKHIEQLRMSPSYMHGDFRMYNSEELLAYSRIKSGNPGYFVAFNPTETAQKGNFSNLGLPDKMTVDAISANYNVSDVSVKSKISTDSLEVSPLSTIILTYVPVK